MATPTNVPDYVTKGIPQGLKAYNPADPFASLYPIICQRNMPANVDAKGFMVQCEAMLRAGGLIYAKQVDGDCGAATLSGGPDSNSQIVGLAGQGAGLTIGGLGAVGVLSGAATFGIGAGITVAVAAITDIFQHHAQAVANEQRTICSVVNTFNAAKSLIDNAVMSGQITPGEAVTYLTQVANQAKTGLSSIEKVCNAACYFKGFISAQVDFARQYYPSIAPNTGQLRPGQAPTAFGSLPGGVPSTANNPAPQPPLRSLYGINTVPVASPVNTTSGTTRSVAVQSWRTPTGQSGQLADVPPVSSGLDWKFFAVIAAIIVAVLAGSQKAVAAT